MKKVDTWHIRMVSPSYWEGMDEKLWIVKNPNLLPLPEGASGAW